MTKKLFYLILTTTIVLFVALKADNLLAQRRINNLIYLINTYQNNPTLNTLLAIRTEEAGYQAFYLK